MCLSVVENKKEVLKRNRKTKCKWFYCYSVGQLGPKGRFYPAFYSGKPYKLGFNESLRKRMNWEKYIPYFHRFFTFKDARRYYSAGVGEIILKWKIFVKDITACGKQDGMDVLVAPKIYLIGRLTLKGRNKK